MLLKLNCGFFTFRFQECRDVDFRINEGSYDPVLLLLLHQYEEYCNKPSMAAGTQKKKKPKLTRLSLYELRRYKEKVWREHTTDLIYLSKTKSFVTIYTRYILDPTTWLQNHNNLFN